MRELKVLPVAWYDESCSYSCLWLKMTGVWPDGLLDAYVAMIPKTDGDAAPLGQTPLSVLPNCVPYLGLSEHGSAWRGGSSLGFLFRFSVVVVVVGRLRLGMLLLLILRKFLLVLPILMFISVADVIKSFDTVDTEILDRVLSSLGLPAWFRHAYFEYHLHVRLRFKLAAGLGEPWTRDGRILQVCPLSMMFIVALYLPWCRYLSGQVGVEPQLFGNNPKCVSRDPDLLLNATRFTTGYVRLVGQEPAPSKCVLLSTPRAVRKDMKYWVLAQEGDEWSVKFDVRDLGGHLDTTFREWSVILASRVRIVISRLVLIFALPLDFHGRVRVVSSIFCLMLFIVLSLLCWHLTVCLGFAHLFSG